MALGSSSASCLARAAAQVVLAVCLFTAITHFVETLVLIGAASGTFFLFRYVGNSGLSLRTPVALSTAQIQALVVVALVVGVVATLGTVIFTLIGVATTAVLVHGIFRDTPVDMDRIDDLGVERADGMGMEDDKVEMDDDAARPRHPETA